VTISSPACRQPLSIAERGRIGECSLDLVGAGEHFSESVAKAQWNASASLLLLAELLAEALDATRGVDQALLASEERMALGADVGMDLGLGGARLEGVAAGALHGGRVVLWMDAGLHGSLWVRD